VEMSFPAFHSGSFGSNVGSLAPSNPPELEPPRERVAVDRL
jgi:hypothetical protein